MLKWVLILLGSGFLLLIGLMIIFGLMVWNHERGYPKSILSDEVRGACFVSKIPFVLVKTPRANLGAKISQALSIPDGPDFVYGDYIPGAILTADGADIYDLTDAIEVPVGTRFILTEGVQHRTLNESRFYYWMAPETLALDSSYIFKDLPMTTRDGETYFYSVEEMSTFPDRRLFERACETDA